MKAVELQSFIESKWAEFRASNPGDGQMSETQRRARWSYDTFYVHYRFFSPLFFPERIRGEEIPASYVRRYVPSDDSPCKYRTFCREGGSGRCSEKDVT